jgi:hypothetical protein
MAVTKIEKIPSVSDDSAVKVAQKLLTDIQAKFEKASHYPLLNDTTERARSILDNKPPKPRREVDEINVLREAVTLASHRLQAVQAAAAERIIDEIKPLHVKAVSELLSAAEKFSTELLAQAEFVESCWRAGLFNYLPAAWSLKWRIVLTGKPGLGSRLDELILNLRASLE